LLVKKKEIYGVSMGIHLNVRKKKVFKVNLT